MSNKIKPLKIYIAGPYTGRTDEEIEINVKTAIDAGITILHKGHFPFIPHLTHFVDVRSEEIGHSIKWEHYIEWDLIWLQECDALLFMNSSRGAMIELEAAKKWGKQIFHSINEVPEVNTPIDKKLNFIQNI